MKYVLLMNIWSVGQGVKTPPFHGGNTGSNPVRTIFLSDLGYSFYFVSFFYML